MSDTAATTQPPPSTAATTDESGFIEYKIAQAILVYGYSTLLILGTLSNAASLLVLRCKSFRTSSGSSRLSMLAILHLAVLYTPILRGWIQGVFNFDVRATSSLGCKLHCFLTYFLTQFSSWTLTLIVIERALVVCFHMLFKQYATRRNVLMVWLLVALVIALINSHIWFTMDYIPDPTGYEKVITPVTETPVAFNSTLPPSTSNDTMVEYVKVCFHYPQYQDFFLFVWPTIDAIVLIILPFILIFAGNLAILIVIRRAMVFQAHNSAKRKRHNSEDGHDRGSPTQSTLMLLGASVTFLLLALPNGIFFILSNYIINQDSSHAMVAKYWLAYAITSFLFYLGTSVNFFVYYVSGSKFRKSCKECFSTNIFKSEAQALETRTFTSKL